MKVNVNVKRILSMVLVFAMVLTMMPVTGMVGMVEEAYAADRFVDNTKLDLNLAEVVLTEGRPIDYECIKIVYTSDRETPKANWPAGTDVSSWFTNLPGGVTACIGEYYRTYQHYPTQSDEYYELNIVQINLVGIPDDAAPYYKFELEIPASFYTDGQAKTFKGNTNVEELGSACSGCTLKTINGIKVCYKEGSGIHVCETNFGDDMNDVGLN